MPHFVRFAYSDPMSTTWAAVSRVTTGSYKLLGATFLREPPFVFATSRARPRR